MPFTRTCIFREVLMFCQLQELHSMFPSPTKAQLHLFRVVPTIQSSTPHTVSLPITSKPHLAFSISVLPLSRPSTRFHEICVATSTSSSSDVGRIASVVEARGSCDLRTKPALFTNRPLQPLQASIVNATSSPFSDSYSPAQRADAIHPLDTPF